LARINIVIPAFSPVTFSGGLWCIFEYAHGLSQRGHQVTLIPSPPCAELPRWFDRDLGTLITTPMSRRLKWALEALGKSLKSGARLIGNGTSKAQLGQSLQELCATTALLRPGLLTYEFQNALTVHYVERVIPQAEVTLATSYRTGLPVALVAPGRLYYFMQGYEPYFFRGDLSKSGQLAEREASLSYRLGLNMIANSSWLKSKVEQELPGSRVQLCVNAVNHEVFRSNPHLAKPTREINVVSYSGRSFELKGFREIAEAIKIAREKLPDYRINLLVFGQKAELPPNNSVAPYEDFGFLQPRDLSKLHERGDIFLSASWYESFPLFPLEAMASGLPVITTPCGTEDYAIAGQTVEVVEARNPTSIANGLIRLITDVNYRNRIAKSGNEIARQFTWEKSVATLERLLVDGS